MNRKNTILLAVFINAALLIVLFATALTTQEEITLAPTHEISSVQESSPPMFGDELDLILRAPSPRQETSPETLAVAPIADHLVASKTDSPPIVHSLPPVQSNHVAVVESTLPLPVFPKIPETKEVASSFAETQVKKGDTLEKIARAHRTTVDEIIRLNHLPSSFLRVGQVLKLPQEKTAAVKPSPVEKPVSTSGPDYYTVKVGDNPWMIAVKHHLKLEELLRLNGLNEEKARKLKPGDRLRIR